MWKKEDVKSQGVPGISTGPAQSAPTPSVAPAPARESAAPAPPISPRAAACISQGIKIKGEVHGTEDLFIDGQIEGKLDLGGASVTIGPNGTVKADITAREVIVRGRVNGKITGRERVQVWKGGEISGEVTCERISIEDGGAIHGKVEAGKAPGKADTRTASFGSVKPQDATGSASGTKDAAPKSANSAAAGSAAD
jgi:cytoskeletal protein CcmA (bactofilin family)